MPAQYSDSSGALLALDTASPRISVALGREGRVLASREAPSGRASPSLLRLIDELLDETGLTLDELGGLIGVRGPGSFTGLRVGLSTLLGLHRSLGVQATAISTFTALAWQARSAAGPILTAIDALRGEWFSQLFDPGNPPASLEPPRLRDGAAIKASGAATLIGFDLEPLLQAAPDLEILDATPLAPTLIERATLPDLDWNPLTLTEPLYLRPPATTRSPT